MRLAGLLPDLQTKDHRLDHLPPASHRAQDGIGKGISTQRLVSYEEVFISFGTVRLMVAPLTEGNQ